ncbi:hypothetical protein EJ03DRAFT_330915 [Teratosphaeria nubilosa]|uniref:Secreted protein n=1 Tax=Teratosphaeria nubilosa TaxID=161662 RepID=A0A6G1KYV2_9PEZI|nr:hypothetical protein EJ03DRAFT_330915 [Teratosphaeria nubilosa]
MQPVIMAIGLLSLLLGSTTAANCKQSSQGSQCGDNSQRWLHACTATWEDPGMAKGPPDNNCKFLRLGRDAVTSVPTKYYCCTNKN